MRLTPFGFGFAAKIARFRNELVSRHSYKRLTDTYNPEEFRMGLYKSGLAVTPAGYVNAGEFDIEFDCKPQRWLVSGETAQTFTVTGTITNPTLFPARPLLAVTGAGILTVGTQTIAVIVIIPYLLYSDEDIVRLINIDQIFTCGCR